MEDHDIGAGDRVVLSEVDANGLVPLVRFVFESSDCSGPRLRRTSSERFFPVAGVLNQDVYFAGDPVEPHTFASIAESIDAAECPGFGGVVLPDGLCCISVVPFVEEVGPAVRADRPSLGTPPFRLQMVR